MKIVIFIFCGCLLCGCKPTRKEISDSINEQSLEIVNLSFTYSRMDTLDLLKSEDSLRFIYNNFRSDSAELGLIYAKHIDSIMCVQRKAHLNKK